MHGKIGIALCLCLALPAFGLDGLAYRLDKPSFSQVLPPKLREISGICMIDANRMACIQDEQGIISVWDITAGKIVGEYPFGPNGDYEDLSISGDRAFVLRSDGTIFVVSDYTSEAPRVARIHPKLPAADIEGLCRIGSTGRLLLAHKSNLKGGASRNLRRVFSINPEDENGKPSTFFTVDLAMLPRERMALSAPGKKAKKKEKPKLISFRPSALAVHPSSGETYILSAEEPWLLVIGPDGEFKSLSKLEPEIFRQPEGISFSPDGRLYVSNEGLEGAATILGFDLLR